MNLSAFRGKLGPILRIFVGFVFLFSAISKLVSIDSFEIYIYSFGFLKLDISFFLARFIISIELLLGILLATGSFTKQAKPISIIILLLFSGFILYLLVSGKKEHCHCFGEINLSHGKSIVKNLVLVVLLVISGNALHSPLPYQKYILFGGLFLSFALPLILYPPDSFLYRHYAEELSYDDILLTEYLNEHSQYCDGRKVLCFFSTGCRFCKLAARKISVMSEKANEKDIIFFIFAGDVDSENAEVAVENFFSETSSFNFQYSFLSPNRFLRITNGKMPLIILLENGQIHGKYAYRDIVEAQVIDFLMD